MVCGPVDNEIFTFKHSSATWEQRLMENGVLRTSFPDNLSETIDVLIQAPTTSYTSVKDNMDSNSNTIE